MKKLLFLFIMLSSVVTAQVTVQWIAVYDGPSGSIDSVRNLVMDNAGNVYVTGSSTSSNLWDYTTLKYSPGGVLLWEARYDGPNHFRDDARWIAIDNSGNTYVTGFSRSGVQAGTEDFATVKYDANGLQQWAVRYNGSANSVDVAVRVAVDTLGNVYVTGYSYGIEIDYATIKYNADGVQQWVKRYNGTGNSQDAPTALAVDNNGSVYVTGWSRSTSLFGSEDFLTICYNTDGIEQWVARYNGPSNLIDQSFSIALDNNRNVHVTGYSLSPSTQSDYVTIKYNYAGVQQWLTTYNNTSFNGSDIARMVIVDNSGNVYVTGTSGTAYPFGYPDYVTIKYNSLGAEQWVSAYNGPGNAEDVPYSIAVDNLANVYVTGKTTVPGFYYDFATVKYSPVGVQLWEQRFNGASNMHDGATWVAVDNSGNVYVAGNSMYYTNFASDFVILKYTQSSPPVVMQLDLTLIIQGFYDENGNTMVQDTATVYLRNTSSPYNKIDTAKAILSSSGQGTFTFENASPGVNYYIQVNNRNSVETWSATEQSFTNSLLIYDFSTSSAQAFGNNVIQVDASPVRFAIYNGDVNQDDVIDLSDIVSVFNDARNFVSGFVNTDLTGDMIIDLSDMTIAYNNSAIYVHLIRP